jgi:hypothetical protein
MHRRWSLPWLRRAERAIAMYATIGTAAYNTPTLIEHQHDEWLVVSCWGGDANYLAVSRTGLTASAAEVAPDGLQPATTFLGILIERAPEEAESTYLIVRRLPAGVSVAGVFLPADGFCSVVRAGGTITLRAAGRLAHSIGHHSGKQVRKDIPDPAPNSEFAFAWHIRATQRPWIGEF